MKQNARAERRVELIKWLEFSLDFYGLDKKHLLLVSLVSHPSEYIRYAL